MHPERRQHVASPSIFGEPDSPDAAFLLLLLSFLLLEERAWARLGAKERASVLIAEIPKILRPGISRAGPTQQIRMST